MDSWLIDTLIEPSRSQSRAAATHRLGERGMSTSAADEASACSREAPGVWNMRLTLAFCDLTRGSA
jgi:hypothetical protein